MNAWRRCKKIKRVPAWVNFSEDILPIYRAAKALGDNWEIDHIIPLRGKLVCGLHVPENLQPIPKCGNELKSDSFDESMLPKFDKERDLYVALGLSKL